MTRATELGSGLQFDGRCALRRKAHRPSNHALPGCAAPLYVSLRSRSEQWRNDAPGAPATPGGAVIGGRQIVRKMWDNFARLTALLAKVRVWFNNLTIYLEFSAIFSLIAPSKPLNQGRHWGRLFAAEGRHFDKASNVTPLDRRG